MAFIQSTTPGTSGFLSINSDNAAEIALESDVMSGFATLTTDANTVENERSFSNLESSLDRRLKTGIAQPMFNLSFEGTNIARDRIQQNDTTATAAQTNGILTINSGLSTTSAQGCNIRTYRTFPLFGPFATSGVFWMREGNHLATNAISEWGFGYCSGVTTQLTDGVFFRRTGGGQLRVVITYNSTDIIVAGVDESRVPAKNNIGYTSPSEMTKYKISWNNDIVTFSINGYVVAKLDCSSIVGSPTSAMNLPIFARVFNPVTAGAARSIGIGFIQVSQNEMGFADPISLVGMGNGAYQIQPGTTSGPTVTRGTGALGWPTSATARISGAYTATTAPALNSMGGLWTTPQVGALSSDVDYPVFSYSNPAGTATLPGKVLYITGIRVGETSTSTLASSNGAIISFAAGIGSTTSASTATEAATVVAARIVPLGAAAFTASAAAGDSVEGFDVDFTAAPIVCYPGHFLQFIIRPFGTFTGNTLVLRGSVSFRGYYA
jgi:hypothetical protein